MNTTEMKRYKSGEWNFALDIPGNWHAFPPVSANSPFEVIRFASKENGTHLVIIFRALRDPKMSLREICDQARQRLASHGFGNFTITETAIESRAALVLEFDRPHSAGARAGWRRWVPSWLHRGLGSRVRQAETWSCREYFLADGALQYTLGFGTTNKDSLFELYDRMARSFEFSAE